MKNKFITVMFIIGVLQIQLLSYGSSTADLSSNNNIEVIGIVNQEKNETYLYRGNRGIKVKELQSYLRQTGDFKYDKITGYFGSITEKAVKTYQRRNGLREDGIVYHDMMEQLRKVFKKGSVYTNRGTHIKRTGEPLDWWKEVKGILINRGDNLKVEDFRTGISFNVMVTYGTNHADVEAVTPQDTSKMKEVWGDFSWERRPVLIHLDDQSIAASMTFMPHAGKDNKKEGITINNRSGGFGRGYNYDKIKNNGMDGHVDIHFNNSTRHMDGKEDTKHQNAVLESAGLL